MTFTLEPRRSRIVVAKFLAGIGLAVGVMVLAVVLAVLGTLLGIVTGGDPSWSLDGNLVFSALFLSTMIGILIGFALAMLIMNTAGRDRRLLRLHADPAHRGGAPQPPE